MQNEKEIRFMQGNEAVVEAALAAGVNFFAGYPITPASEITEMMSIKLPEKGGVFLQMEDEIASMASIIGASMGGMKSMTATSGPGFSLMQENIGYATAVEIPCVVVNVMRGGPASGMATLPSQSDVMQSRWGTHGDHPIVVLSPSSVSEAYDLTIKAVNISELIRNPVIILSDAMVGHVREGIEIPDLKSIKVIDRKKTTLQPGEYKPFAAGEDGVPEFAERGMGYRYHVCSNAHGEDGFPADMNHEAANKLIRRLHHKIAYYKKDITFYKTMQTDDAELLIIAYGCVARSAKEAVIKLRNEGIKVGLLQLQTLWPFASDIVGKLCGNVKMVLVPEMNLGQIIEQVKISTDKKVIGLNRVDGRMITPAEIINKIKEEK